jgi:hypothetical protein
MESFGYSQIENYGNGSVKAIEDIGAMPRLERKAMTMQIFADGSY